MRVKCHSILNCADSGFSRHWARQTDRRTSTPLGIHGVDVIDQYPIIEDGLVAVFILPYFPYNLWLHLHCRVFFLNLGYTTLVRKLAIWTFLASTSYIVM